MSSEDTGRIVRATKDFALSRSHCKDLSVSEMVFTLRRVKSLAVRCMSLERMCYKPVTNIEHFSGLVDLSRPDVLP